MSPEGNSRTQSSKLRFLDYVRAFALGSRPPFEAAVREIFHPGARIEIVHPYNSIGGPDTYLARFIGDLCSSFDSLYRNDYIVMAGEFDGAAWVSATGYYRGRFSNDWLGIRANGQLANLRFGEFHRFSGDLIDRSYIFLDLPEFMMSVGQWPLAPSAGYCGFLPGPGTFNGVTVETPNDEESRATLNLVAEMLLRLNTTDQSWRPYWHRDMLWYGPAAFGSYIGIEEFAGFQVPFEGAFESWSGGISETSPTRHFTRYAEGKFACSGGWPSLSGRHVKPFLGFEPTGREVVMRVCDWWRREGDLLVENWVLVDIPDLLLQFDFDLFSHIRKEL